ncbi:hypothetical protein FRC08_001064 [Ceratobasidium sp. 394]|nr:hypothetical protein FRC08_001064 [Ceratobasidium sp. 394]KAG9089278.1 hypothetical protein FS749_001453 [Ceratobasidium sp. UAMH 11750]
MVRPNTEEAKARQQAQRAIRREKAEKITAVLREIEEKTHDLLEAAAEDLDCDLDELRRAYLANASAHLHAKPTAWNGLVHEKSKEWANMKGECVALPQMYSLLTLYTLEEYSGGKYIQYVVERIKKEDLYNKMSEADEARYIEIAQKLRDSKLNVGTSRNGIHRKTPGNVFAELEAMGQRLLHIHNVTGVEGLLVVVRGSEKDGMSPVYVTSPKAKKFIEGHLKLDTEHLVTLFECSVIGGAAAVANHHRTETQIVKSNVRVALLESLRTAATSIASDGSEPTITNPLEISSISYSDYMDTIDRYKVEAFVWPIKEDKLVDPSNVGGHRILSSYLKLIETGKAGFRRMTDAQWEAWRKARDEAEVVIPAKRPPRKRAANPSASVEHEEQPQSKRARKEPSKAKPKSKGKAKTKGKGSARDVGGAPDTAPEATGSSVPAGDIELAGNQDNNDSGAPMLHPSPLVGPLPLSSSAPDSPPIDEPFRITINPRPPPTPPTPTTVTDSAPPSSPNFLLHPISTQPHPYNSVFDPSQGSPSRGRRSHRSNLDRTFVNHTPDSMSSGRPPSRSTSPAPRSSSPARRTRSNKAHAPATASPLASFPISLPGSSLPTNDVFNPANIFSLLTSHSPTPPPLGFGPPSHWFGPDNSSNQHAFSQGEWFGGLRDPLLGTPELGSTTPALSEFAAPDA